MVQGDDTTRSVSARADASRYEDLLGEPLVVADPRITAAQVVRVLGITRSQVRGLADRGELPRRGGRGKERQFLLSDVRRLEASITVDEAGQIWACSREAAGRIIEQAAFAAIRSPLRPLRRVDAVLEQGRRWRRAGPDHPGRVEPRRDLLDRPRWSSKQRRSRGWIGTTEGAAVLGIGPSYARRLAVRGGLPAEQDAAGRWWFEADRIQLIADVRAFQREQEWSIPPWAYGERVSRGDDSR